ncbi:hypothetical protein AB0J55_43865 [Amycolatopsis sp. NPDC049688]|uniref:hypothetical protein n=1 Tax=Amycolatopsis sp. NPDC049688 TaxID=3154733 RepID=UPI00342C8F43
MANQVDGDVDGQVFQFGFVHGDLHVNSGKRVRTRYRQQVLQRIAPPRLLERETELAELAEFCSSPSTAGAYRWWRAEAWSGKSALMSWFALHPPEGVELVSFFVTARLAGQNDRSAFIDNVMEQLLTLLGEDRPAFLTDTTREAHLLGLLQEAAEACRRRGGTFVLLIDGLDEDRGAGIDPDAHSIAALLPAHPPAGMRVIVAGRPHPPVPSDVPRHHPLRDPAIVRTLEPSQHALSARDGMQRELKRLLRGTPIEQSLLGLVTAAGGGLTAADLAELTGQPEWEIDDHLATVAGRSFTKREGAEAAVYLLGHEELQLAAITMLGPARLAIHRDTLHSWADDHRALGWPAETPGYLLRSYFTMLTATFDLKRMVACATDLVRHDRMLDVSGGDALALAEITTTQNFIVAQPAPDLVAMTRLSIHRDHLTDRNSHIPPSLPELWATLGQINRAESIASSIEEPADRVQALAAVARIAESRGDPTRAGEILAAAKAVALNILHPERRAKAMAAICGTPDADPEPAVSSPPPTVDWVAATAELSVALGSAGRSQQARALVDNMAEATEKQAVRDLLARIEREQRRHKKRRDDNITMSTDFYPIVPAAHRMPTTIGTVIEDLIRFGSEDPRRADELLTAAESLLPRRSSWYRDAQDLARLARARFAIGADDRALALLEEAEQSSRRVDDPGTRAEQLVAVAHAAARIGLRDRADSLLAESEEACGEIRDPQQRVSHLVDIAQGRLKIGDTEQVASLLTEVEGISRSIIDPIRRIRVLAELAPAALRAGRTEIVRELLVDVEAMARGVAEDWALAPLVRAVSATGDVGRAERIAAARSHSPDIVRAVVLGLVDAHDTGAALVVANHLPRDERSVPTYVTMLKAALEQDDGRAVDTARADLERLVVGLPASGTTVKVELELARVARRRNVEEEVDRRLANAVRVAATFGYAHRPDTALLAEIAAAAVDTGRRQLATQLIEQVEQVTTHESPAGWALTLLALARLAHRIDQLGRADDLLAKAESNAVLYDGDRRQIIILAAAARTAHDIGRSSRSWQLLDDAERAARALTPAGARDWALVEVVNTALLLGDHSRAFAIADSMEHSTQLITVLLAIARCSSRLWRDRALTRALQSTQWYKCAEQLVQADPGVLDAAVVELNAIVGS